MHNCFISRVFLPSRKLRKHRDNYANTAPPRKRCPRRRSSLFTLQASQGEDPVPFRRDLAGAIKSAVLVARQ